MKKLTLFISILLITQLANAQITFQKTYGGTGFDSGAGVQQTADGGYAVTGFVENYGAGGPDLILIKTNASGDTLWTKTYGTTSDEGGRDMQQTNDGGYILTGFGTSALHDIYLVKTDGNGNITWSRTFGAVGTPEGESVIQTTDGGYFLSGDDGLHIILIKTDMNGDTSWTRNYVGTSSCRAYSVVQTTDGGYIVSGYTNVVATSLDFYLLKLGPTGDSLWTKTYGGTLDEQGRSVRQTSDGGYIIAGKTFFSFGAGSDDVYIVRTDSIGNVLWSKTFGGTNNDRAYAVEQTSDGGFIIAGETESFGAGMLDAYLVKTDSNGTLMWSKTYGGGDWDAASSVRQTSDGGYILTGFTASFGAGAYDIFLLKTDAIGNIGCNQGNPLTIENTVVTITGNPGFSVSGGGFVNLPSTIMTSGFPYSTLCFSTFLNETTVNNFCTIYPNPSTGNFIISFEATNIKGKVEILNILGENVFAENILNESKKEINLKNISSGIYFVKVFDGEKSYCKKLIVE